MTAIQTLISVANLSGQLGIVGDNLKTRLPRDCPQWLKDAIREQKPGLLALLRLVFLIVRSEELKTTVFWTPDEETKQALYAAGASPDSIYTKHELEQLVRHRITREELPLIHSAKKQFSGKLTDPECQGIGQRWNANA